MSRSSYSRRMHHQNTSFKKYLKTHSKKAWKRFIRLARAGAGI